MNISQQSTTWQTASQQQFTNLATFAREHRALLQVAGIVALAATTGAVVGVIVGKGVLVAKGAVAVPTVFSTTPLAQGVTGGVPTMLANSAAALGQAATLTKGAVTTGTATLQNANALLNSVTTGSAAVSSQWAALLHTVSSNLLPLTAGVVGGGTVGVGVTQRQVRAVKEQLQAQTTQAAAYQAETVHLQAALTAATQSKSASVPEPPTLAQDPLEQIRGIGPVFARHLHTAGIFTFTDLAAQTPEQLRTLMASVRTTRMFNPQAWIDEARQRTGQAPPGALPPEATKEAGADDVTASDVTTA